LNANQVLSQLSYTPTKLQSNRTLEDI